MKDKDMAAMSAAISAVVRAGTNDFVELVAISGLDRCKDFRYTDLSDVSVRNCDLSDFDFTGALLQRCDFRGATIDGETISEALLEELFPDIDLTGATFGESVDEPPLDWRKEIEAIEADLYEESRDAKTDVLNRKRVEILSALNPRDKLSSLLPRRFLIGIAEEVAELVDEAVRDDSTSHEHVRAILSKDASYTSEALLRSLSGPDDLVANALAHRLISTETRLPRKLLAKLLTETASPARLPALAALATASEDRELADVIARKVRKLMTAVHGVAERESIGALVNALISLDHSLGVRTAMVADTVFWSTVGGAEPGVWPWSKVFLRIQPNDDDCEKLLEGELEDARAVVHLLFAQSCLKLVSGKGMAQVRLSLAAKQSFKQFAENDAPRQHHLWAAAAPKAGVTTLMAWMLKAAKSREQRSISVSLSHQEYGRWTEPALASILRAVGYTARTLLDLPEATKTERADARSAVRMLRAMYEALAPTEDPKVVSALCTALGFVGQVEPLLARLDPKQPWMLEAARNSVQWIADDEKRRIASWIEADLQGRPQLAKSVKTTLESVKHRLKPR